MARENKHVLVISLWFQLRLLTRCLPCLRVFSSNFEKKLRLHAPIHKPIHFAWLSQRVGERRACSSEFTMRCIAVQHACLMESETNRGTCRTTVMRSRSTNSSCRWFTAYNMYPSFSGRSALNRGGQSRLFECVRRKKRFSNGACRAPQSFLQPTVEQRKTLD